MEEHISLLRLLRVGPKPPDFLYDVCPLSCVGMSSLPRSLLVAFLDTLGKTFSSQIQDEYFQL